MYIINFISRTIEKLGITEDSKIKRERWNTYFNYLTYKRTIEKTNNKNVIKQCEIRLNEMEHSNIFDVEFVHYLNSKNIKNLPYK